MSSTDVDLIKKLESMDIDPAIYELFEFKPRKGDLKKIEIIKAAIECLGTLGVEKTTFEAIATKIGTRRAHVAYHFKDKNDIFKSAIRYIVANYQNLSIQHLSNSQSDRDMLFKYVEAVFMWASKNPHEVAVMLMLYYFCTFDPSYKELNNQIRSGGIERINYLLTNKVDKTMDSRHAIILSKSIQNLTSAAIIDAFSTVGKSLDEAREDVFNTLELMINNS